MEEMEIYALNKKEFSIFVAALKTFYPREQLLPNQQAMGLWFQMLGDIPYQVAEAALQKWVATNKFSPTIAEIRELASSIQHGDVPDWGDAWQNVREAVQRYGWYRQEEAMASLDEITRECVRRIGFERLCHSEEPALERANFRMVYETMAQRRKTQEQLPTGLATLIGQIKESLMIEEAKNE